MSNRSRGKSHYQVRQSNYYGHDDRGGGGGAPADNYSGGSNDYYRGASRGRGYRGRGRGRRNNGYRQRGGRGGRGGGNPSHNSQKAEAAAGYDPDGDFDMEGGDAGETTQRYNPYKRPEKRSSRSRSNKKHGTSRNPAEQWYFITVYEARDESEEELMSKFESCLFKKFPYRQFYVDREHAHFFVQGHELAREITSCTKRIDSITGGKYSVHKRDAVKLPLSDAQLKLLEQVLTSRFDEAKGHLDLSRLYHDPIIRTNNVHLMIKHADHTALVVQKLKTIITDMQANAITSIDCSDNQLRGAFGICYLVQFAPNVKVLNLSKNFFRFISDLSHLKEWNLTALSLDENPLCENFSSETEYISDARDLFPDLEKLDSKDLPPPVKFDAGTSNKLPEDVGHNISLLPNSAAQNLIDTFVTNYFKFIDEDRSKLEQVFAPDAIFTLSIPGKSPRGPPLSQYFAVSRNILKKKSSRYENNGGGRNAKTSATKNTFCGVKNIVDVMKKLPVTSHMVESFAVDITMFEPEMIVFVIHGLFNEGTNTGLRPRAFTRKFVCRHVQNNPLCMVILNDQLHLRNSTATEVKNKAISSATKKPAAATPSPAMAQAPAVLTDAQKEALVIKFSAYSRLTPHFSMDCLAANQWNYEKSQEDFLRIKDKIPREAFQQ